MLRVKCQGILDILIQPANVSGTHLVGGIFGYAEYGGAGDPEGILPYISNSMRRVM